MKRAARAALAAFLLIHAQRAPAQEEAAEAAPEALLDLANGALHFTHDGERCTLTFPALRLPEAGEHALGDGEGPLGFLLSGTPAEGVLQLDVARFERLAGVARVTGRSPLRFDVRPVLGRLGHRGVIDARAVPEFTPPSDEPDRDDLVFCALGSAGTGAPGQHRVAAAIEKLAESGPLDFVLLLGDQFPGGVRSRDDPLWTTRFHDVYDRGLLPVTFWFAPGDEERRGDLGVVHTYGAMDLRFSAPGLGYAFTQEAHGSTFTFVCMDTQACLGDIRHPENRIARSLVAGALDHSEADWKIVFGHDPMHTHGASTEAAARLARAMEGYLERFDVDLYVAGGDHSLQLIDPGKGYLQIVSGGGGGPDVADDVRWGEDTIFAATGGGFVWFRFDGAELEVSFRDSDGDVLYVHRLRK